MAYHINAFEKSSAMMVTYLFDTRRSATFCMMVMTAAVVDPIGLKRGVSFPPFEKPDIRMFVPRVIPPFWLAQGRWSSAYNLLALLAGILLAVFHCFGTVAVFNERFTRCASGPARTGTARCRDSVYPLSCVVERVEHLKH